MQSCPLAVRGTAHTPPSAPSAQPRLAPVTELYRPIFLAVTLLQDTDPALNLNPENRCLQSQLLFTGPSRRSATKEASKSS